MFRGYLRLAPISNRGCLPRLKQSLFQHTEKDAGMLFTAVPALFYADIFGYQVYWLSHYFYVHESAEHLKILNIVSVYDDDMLSGNGLLVVLHIHTGLKKH